MTAVEPLWQERTADVVKQFLETGSVAILCTVRDSYLEDHFLGSELNDRFLRTCYDRGIDPCGEKAEFHTVVTRFGFAPSLKLRAGRIHKSDGCSSIDLELISGDGSSRDLKP
jgi:diphthamide synthase (EF-2-diphthine--ammonia ligase)